MFIPYGPICLVVAHRRKVDEMMSALRDAVGPEVDVMVDFHGRPASIAAAMHYLEVLAPYRPAVLRGAGATR